MGHLALFDDKPKPPDQKLLFIFKLFAARAASEINRLQMLEKLHQSEKLYRDPFDEGPIAYVNEDLESRRHANSWYYPRASEGHGGHLAYSRHTRCPTSSTGSFCFGQQRHRHQRRNLGTAAQGQQQALVDRMVVEIRSERRIHKNMTFRCCSKSIARFKRWHQYPHTLLAESVGCKWPGTQGQYHRYCGYVGDSRAE